MSSSVRCAAALSLKPVPWMVDAGLSSVYRWESFGFLVRLDGVALGWPDWRFVAALGILVDRLGQCSASWDLKVVEVQVRVYLMQHR